MLSQSDSAIQFRQIMDEGLVLFVDLSSLGSEMREILGSLILTLFMMSALSRSDQAPQDRKPFSVFADEAHLFVSADAIENIIAQARKFQMSICIAHQYLRQFKLEQVDALSTVGATILGRLDKRDSHHFSKDLQDLVEPKELIRLRPFEMIARIGTDIVRIQTERIRAADNQEKVQRIIESSRRRYCKKADEVRRFLERRSGQSTGHPAVKKTHSINFALQDLAFDEY